MQEKRCAGCAHRRYLSGDDGMTVCHFSLDTGTLRGMSAAQCFASRAHYKRAEAKRPRTPPRPFARPFGRALP